MDPMRPRTQENGRMAWDDDTEYSTTSDEPVIKCPKEQTQNVGCWGFFSFCFGGLWSTKDMFHKDLAKEKEVYMRTTLRELIVYIIFLAVLCVVTFGVTSPTMFYFTSVLNDIFMNEVFDDQQTNFLAATQIQDFWNFLDHIFLESVYWENWYDNQTVLEPSQRNILYENRLLGVPRIRQIRVRNDSCVVADAVKSAIVNCFSPYKIPREDKSYFGNGLNGTQWMYTDAATLGGINYWGLLSTYSGGGNYVDLGTNRSITENIFGELRRNLWVTRGTRIVFLDFSVYNANINLFCIVKFVFEMPPVGGVISAASFRTVKLLRYVNAWDYFVLACEVIFVIYVLYYIVEELAEIHTTKWEYLNSNWNYLDMLVIVLSLICVIISAYCTATINSTLSVILQYPDKFANFELLAYWQMQYNNVVAVTVFFSWFKLFKYISFNKTMTQLSATLSRCSKDVAGFGIMFFIVFFAFAQLGYLLFGTQVQDYSTCITAIFSLLRTILGDFNFSELQTANRVLGPLFFLSYVFFVFFVLLNMFLAIINDTYSEVKLELANQHNEYELGDYFKRGYNNMMGKLGKPDRSFDIENALRSTSSDQNGMVAFGDVRTSLRKHNFSDLEIEMFFANYDIDGSRLLEPDEVIGMLKEMEKNRGGKNGEDPQVTPPKVDGDQPIAAVLTTVPVPTGEFNIMQKQVASLEGNIGSIVDKIDEVLSKLDTMERSGSTRKKTTNNIETDNDDDRES